MNVQTVRHSTSPSYEVWVDRFSQTYSSILSFSRRKLVSDEIPPSQSGSFMLSALGISLMGSVLFTECQSMSSVFLSVLQLTRYLNDTCIGSYTSVGLSTHRVFQPRSATESLQNRKYQACQRFFSTTLASRPTQLYPSLLCLRSCKGRSPPRVATNSNAAV